MTIDFLGDICLTYYDRSLPELLGLAEGINQLLGDTDFRIANLENPVLRDESYTKIDKRGPSLCMSFEKAPFLEKLNIDCYALANNHMGDYGVRGIESTVRYIEEIGRDYIGISKKNERTLKPARYEKEGVKVSVFAICENEFGTAKSMGYGADGYDIGLVKSSLEREKEEGRVVIIFFHGGTENYTFPSPMQRDRYRLLIDIGADAVINSHQHCCLGMESYKGKYIFYGIGNFFFPRNKCSIYDGGWNYGYTLRLIVNNSKDIAHEMLPHMFDANGKIIIIDKKKFRKFIDTLSAPITRDNILISLYHSWAKIMGSMRYEQLLKEIEKKSSQRDLLIKSLFCCESHNELMNTYMNMRLADEYKNAYSGNGIEEFVNCDMLNDYPKLNVKNVIWGATDKGIRQWTVLKNKAANYESEIIFIDRDIRKQNFRIGGCLILSPELALKRYGKADYYICIPDKYVKDARSLILSYGVEEHRIYDV